MAVLRNGSKCSHTTCMLRLFTVSRLALNTNFIFETGSNILRQKGAFCKGLVEKLREMCSLMRVNLLNLLMADGEGIFI